MSAITVVIVLGFVTALVGVLGWGVYFMAHALAWAFSFGSGPARTVCPECYELFDGAHCEACGHSTPRPTEQPGLELPNGEEQS